MLQHPTLSKNAMAAENRVILWNLWSPKECKHIRPYFTEFSMKINSEFNLEVTFLYEFLPLKVFLFALYLSLITGTKLQVFIDKVEHHYLTTCLLRLYLYLCPLLNYIRQRRGRKLIISRYSKDMSILLFNWKYMLLYEITLLLQMHELKLQSKRWNVDLFSLKLVTDLIQILPGVVLRSF